MREIVQPDDLMQLLAQGMGEELHWFPEDVSAQRLAPVLVGMANTTGGLVVLGVSPRSGRVQGIQQPLEVLYDVIFQAALLPDPSLVLPLPRQLNINGETLVLISVPPGLPNVYSLDGRYLAREGAQTNPIPARRLRSMLIERGVIQFEAQVAPGATLRDINLDKVNDYVQSLQLPGSDDLLEVLLRRGCVRQQTGAGGKGELLPTYAGLLLFSQHPQRWLPNATVLAARFTGSSFADRYLKQDITGTLIEQLIQGEAFIRQNIRSVVRLVNFTHLEEPEYPLEAVRELLVNAIAHRDYNLQGDNIHLNLFADRIEVHSPGGLPGPVSLENLLYARFSRNPVIVQVLADLGYVERLGYGLDRVVQSVKMAGLRPPRFEEAGGSFRVTVFGESLSPLAMATPDISAYLELGLNQRQEAALGYLQRFRRITNSDYQVLCPEVHSETLRRDLSDLVARGLIIKVGDKRSTYYILK